MDGVCSHYDHQKVTILVRQVGNRNHAVFNRVLERLQRQSTIQVSDNPKRVFHANFVTSFNQESIKFCELHLHQRIFGVVGVACYGPSTSSHSPLTKTSSFPENCNGTALSERRNSSLSNTQTLENVRINFDRLKADYSSTTVDSRCIIVGYEEEEVHTTFSEREIFYFSSLEVSSQLENDVREFLRAIYFVLESKRVDISFEKMDPPPCPVLPEEEKFRVGLESRSTKAYRKKCLGRLRKQHADYAMLTGLPQLAIEAYGASIEALKSSNDLLWLAGACEGWACAAMALKFDEESQHNTGLPRVASMTPQQLKEASASRATESNSSATSHQLGVHIGHQRHRSDENTFPKRDDKKKSKILWSALKSDRTKDRIDSAAMLEKFETALENYGKFSIAALVEYNCMMKACSLFRFQRQYIEMEIFHREHVGKYLDDSFTKFDHLTKSAICTNSAAVYKEIGFERKCSFFSRLGVLFRLHTDGDNRAVADYKAIYPILYRTLGGYGIEDDFRDTSSKHGPVQMQIKALHEVYTAASRAQLSDAAIRHICHIIQVYYDDLDPSLTNRLFDDLSNLVRLKETPHALNQRITVGVSNIVLPSIQLARFPSITEPTLCSLPPRLAPTIIQGGERSADIFIYCPFQQKKSEEISWVVDCPGEISVLVYNCRTVELVVRELCLVSDGCNFEPVPVRLILPAAGDGMVPARIKLIGVPRSSGRLQITGYSCEVLGMKNVCKLNSDGPIDVNVLPSLSLLKLESSLPRAPIIDEEEVAAEIRVYSGQTFEYSLTIVNITNVPASSARLQVFQPTVSGGPSLLELTDHDETSTGVFKLGPNERREINFRVFGIDPTATTDDENGDEKIVETHLPLASTLAEVDHSEGAHDLIPYTGRLLSCQFLVHYISDVRGENGETFERTTRLQLAVCIVPAVTVSAWHVLPGDGPFSRYIVVDVTNGTEHDAELVYSSNRRMNVLPKETCRVPLLSPCCSDVAGRAFYVATQKDSHMMQRLEVERLRRTLELHVAQHLDIRWAIPTMELHGLVPVGALLSSVSLLKQLVLPAISLDITVNGIPYVSEDDISVGIGDMVILKVAIISSLHYDFDGILSLECYQEISNQFGQTDCSDNILVIGSKKIPFVVPKNPISSSLPPPRWHCILLDVDYHPCGMPIEHYNACEAFARGQLERSTCRILTQIGFTHANDSSLDLITDITRRYMQTMCSTGKWVAEHCGRTNVTLGDMEFVYDKMRISVAEMSMYMKQVRPLSPRLLPRFPAAPPSRPDSAPLIKKSRSSQIPEWAPPEPGDLGALIQRSAVQKSDSATRPALPDFTTQTAFSLGLCKVNHQISKKKPLSRQPSYAPATRPPSRNEPQNNYREEIVARQVCLPSASTIAEMQGLSVQILSRSGTPLVSPADKSNTGGSTSALPVFKRRIGKRKSQDDSASPSPVPISSNPHTPLARTRKESNVTPLLNDLVKIPSSANKFVNKKVVDTKMGPNPSAPRSSGNLLTLASDLAREPRSVIAAALTGRSATSHHEHLLPAPPISKLNIRGPPGENETPREIVQASILRSLFTPDCNMRREVQEALTFVKNMPSSSVRAAVLPAEGTSNVLMDQFASSPAAPLAQSSAHNSPAYEIIQSAAPVEKIGSLKIKLRRSSFGLPNADSPQNDSRNMMDVSQNIQEHDEKKKKKKKKKDKKEKKERKRSREEAPTDVADVSSPVCVPESSGLKLKIKFGGPRP